MGEPIFLSPRDILTLVGRKFGFELSQMISKKGTRSRNARYIAAILIHENTKADTEAAGACIGEHDAREVKAGLREMRALLQGNIGLKGDFDQLRFAIRQHNRGSQNALENPATNPMVSSASPSAV